ncbi:hypothetical protein QBC46DRAFT_254129 [Diplogelasinospora grovesii]|uniref:Uncharacterized protein n=1 Tax=Diplogelasinospora grovesii TaxID=303347 RepID=A0AAN6NCW8_9PEZI|nr:hypothetical protein QBC46DRAFT_254129 [Diplogelasinospora grovesii]
MPSTVVDLGDLKLVKKPSNLSLALSSSVSVTLPPGCPEPVTAAELCQLSKSGRIWIAKGGSCQINFRTLVNAKPAASLGLSAKRLSDVLDLAADCPVSDANSIASYFLHHPDLSSERLAPSNVPSYKLLGLDCTLDFQVKLPLSTARARHDTKTHKAREATSKPMQRKIAPSWNRRYGLRSTSARIEDALKANEETHEAATVSDSKSRPDSSQALHGIEQDSLVPKDEHLEDMAYLLNAALRKLIGVKGLIPGIRTLSSLQSPPLIEIAPAIWNLRYLQLLAAHAQVIKTVAGGVARLRNARSASLRQKLERVARLATPDWRSYSEVDQEERARGELEKRLWLLCQKGIRVDPVAKSRRRKSAGQMEAESSQSQPTSERFPSQLTPDDSPPQLAAVNAPSHSLFRAEEASDFDFPFYLYPPEVEGDVHHSRDDISSDPVTEMRSHLPMFEDDIPSDHGQGEREDTGASSSESDDLPPYDDFESSEGEYYYADGRGNWYPVPRDVAKDVANWRRPSSPQESQWSALNDPEQINGYPVETLASESDNTGSSEWQDIEAHTEYPEALYHVARDTYSSPSREMDEVN